MLITSKQYQSDERPSKKPRHHGNSKVSQEQMRWELILSLEGDSGTKVLTKIDFGLWLDQNLCRDTFGPRDSDQFISFPSIFIIFIFEALIWSRPYWQAWRPDGWPSLNGCRPRLWFPAWRSHIDQKSSPSCQGIQCLLNEQTHHIFLEAFVPFLVAARNWGAGYFDILCSRVRCQPVWPAAMPGRGHLPSHLPSPQLAHSWDVLTCQHSGLDHLASPVSPSPWQEESHRPPLDHEFTNEIWNAPAKGKIVSYSFTRHRRAYSEARRLKPLKEPYNVWMVELSQNVHFILNFFFWNLVSPSGKWCANKKGPHGTSNLDTAPDLASLLGNPLCHLVGAELCWWTVWIPHNQPPKYATLLIIQDDDTGVMEMVMKEGEFERTYLKWGDFCLTWSAAPNLLACLQVSPYDRTFWFEPSFSTKSRGFVLDPKALTEASSSTVAFSDILILQTPVARSSI